MDHNHITYQDLEIYFKILDHESIDNPFKKSVYDRVKECKICKNIFSYYETADKIMEKTFPEVNEDPKEFVFNGEKYRKKNIKGGT